jgi:putative hydrolase of HD superfamily
MDKLEMILQAREYEEEQGKDLSEFFDSTRGKFKTELGSQWANEIAERRPSLGSPAPGAASEGAETVP